MTLFVFNPEHDLALAANLGNFTAPHAGRQLRADLGYIPALWAGPDDYVLVDNVAEAAKKFSRLAHRRFARFIDKQDLHALKFDAVSPWGWDLAVRAFLLRQGVDERLLPTIEQTDALRECSHRRHAMWLLGELQQEGTVGTASMGGLVEVEHAIADGQTVVVKAPWSSSGRGIRFISGALNDYHRGWIRNVVHQQGAVMIEPFYHKVRDLAMEFESDGDGRVSYCGLSLFHTANGTYSGNILAPEEIKREMISRYVSVALIDDIQQKVCELMGKRLKGIYQGPFGVDMMIVARDDRDGFLLHPCVEINLRRTMGHVALSIPPYADGFARVMRIVLTDKYRIQIRKRQ